ncbi:MAG: alginate lyase family protein [Pseudomonadota bacterium]
MHKSSQQVFERGQWLWRRLTCMSLAEVVYRVQQVAVSRWARHRLLGVAAPAAQLAGMAAAAQLPPQGMDARAYVEEADAILAGQVILFAARRFDVGPVPQWNQDPLSGISGPTSYGPAIDITRRHLVGDIKHVWELNRHMHLVRLAQAFVLTGERRHADGLAHQLRSWLDQCPPLQGPNWTSSLELGIRLINWSMIWQLMGAEGVLFEGVEGARLRIDWLASIHAHCCFIERHFSRHSSANNHLAGELAGLFVAAQTWPCWPQSARWRLQARRELEAQARLQHAADGVNREQAFSYQVFTAEFLLVAGLAGERAGEPFSEGYWAVLRRGIDFLAALRDTGGNVPMVGDADDGIVFRLEPGAVSDRPGMLIGLGAILFGRPEPGPRSDSARWLLGEAPQVRADSEGSSTWDFGTGGYLLFGTRFGEPTEIKGMVDCGPLGYLGIAAHGHADALALTLSVCGEPCLVDPGTYSYWQELKWRDYFRGTSAHNTVRVDRQDQSLSGGRFMWTRKAAVTLERKPSGPEQFRLRAAHDGYARLRDPVRHVRSVDFDAAAATLHVVDQLQAAGSHLAEQFWHFAPGMEVRLDGARITVKGRRFRLEGLFEGGGLGLELVRGSDDPPLGWYSAAYEHKEPCTVLRVNTTQIDQALRARFTIVLS